MIKVGDKVKVITGKYKGKEGKVTTVLRQENRVVVEGINIVSKHVKPNAANETGGILKVEAPIHISNVKKIDAKVEKSEKKAEKAEKKAEPKASKKSKESNK